jgi:hypothetical protein
LKLSSRPGSSSDSRLSAGPEEAAAAPKLPLPRRAEAADVAPARDANVGEAGSAPASKNSSPSGSTVPD